MQEVLTMPKDTSLSVYSMHFGKDIIFHVHVLKLLRLPKFLNLTPNFGYASFLHSEEKILTPLPLYVVKWPFLRGQKTTQKTCKIHYFFTN